MAYPSTQDIIKGLDPTAYVSINPTQLATMIDAATPGADAGMTICTTDTGVTPIVPPANVTTKWKKYLWIRQLASSVIVYSWNENGTNDATYLKWQPVTLASIPDGAVTTAKLADNSVTNSKVVSVDYSKLTNAPSQWYNIGSAAAGGDLTGTYPNPTIGLAKVDNTKIAPNTILDANITNATISADVASGTASKIKPHTVGSYFLRTNAGATLTEWAKSYFTELATIGTAFQSARVNTGATALEWVDTPTIQRLIKSIAPTTTAGTAIPLDNTIPQVGEGDLVATQAITPKLTTSLLRVRAILQVSNATAGTTVIAALFKDGAANAVATGTATISTNNGAEYLTLEYVVASGSTAATTFTVRVGVNGGTAVGVAKILAGTLGATGTSYVTVEEINGTLS